MLVAADARDLRAARHQPWNVTIQMLLSGSILHYTGVPRRVTGDTLRAYTHYT